MQRQRISYSKSYGGKGISYSPLHVLLGEVLPEVSSDPGYGAYLLPRPIAVSGAVK